MKFSGLFAVVGVWAASVAAAPGWTGADVSLSGGHGGHGGGGGGIHITPSCSGQQIFRGWYKRGGCSCPDDKVWRNGKCRLPRPSKPHFGRGEECYCARSENDYRRYDDGDDDYCGGPSTQVFCCNQRDFPRKVREYCPPHPRCPGELEWSYRHKRCTCPGKKIPRRNQCVYPPLPPKHCGGWGQKCFCASDRDNYVEYDEGHSHCADTGGNTVFCSRPNDAPQWCRDNYYID